MATSGSAAKAEANGPGTITDALTEFAAQAAKIPAGPAPDAEVTVAYPLGWALGEALTWVESGNAGHLEEALPGLNDEAERWSWNPLSQLANGGTTLSRRAPAGPRKIMVMPAIVIQVLSASQHPIVASTIHAARNRVVWSAG